MNSKLITSSLICKRAEPRTRLGRVLKRFRWGLYALIVAYVLLLLFPQAIFHHWIEKHGISIYALDPLPSNADVRLDEIHNTLTHSKLYDPDVPVSIFICNDLWVYRLFNPFYRNMYAFTRPMLKQVIIALSDIASDRAGTKDIRTATRTFTAVASHETMHVLIYHHLGFLKNSRLKRWVSEGYCEYVSGNYNYPKPEGIIHLINGTQIQDTSFAYFTWEMMIRYLIEKRKLSFDEIYALQDDYDRIKSEMINWLKELGDTYKLNIKMLHK